MKRSFVFVPAVLMVLVLLNSFVLKEKKASVKPRGEGQSFTGVRPGYIPANRGSFSIAVLKPNMPGPKYAVKVDLNQTGILYIQEAPDTGKTPGNRVNFSVAIQRPDTFFNIPVIEYLGSVQEANLKTILKSCYFGDVILLKTSGPGKYDSNILKIKVDRIRQLRRPKGSKEVGC